MSLKENELDSLASFLEHDLRIHTNIYRLPGDVNEIARVSKLFLAAEKGDLSFSGKKLGILKLDQNEQAVISVMTIMSNTE